MNDWATSGVFINYINASHHTVVRFYTNEEPSIFKADLVRVEGPSETILTLSLIHI